MKRERSTYPWVEVVLGWLGFGVTVLVVGFAALVVSHTVVWPHSFYDAQCCSDADCGPISASRVSRTTSGGYLIDGMHFVPESGARNSPDGQYHACIPPSTKKLRCFYRPPMSM